DNIAVAILEGDDFRLRPAGPADLDFLVELFNHPEVAPFLAAVSPREPAEVREEIEHSQREPREFGRLVIEVHGEDGWRRAGLVGFEQVNRRSRIASLGRLAVHPDFRGRRLADRAARL